MEEEEEGMNGVGMRTVWVQPPFRLHGEQPFAIDHLLTQRGVKAELQAEVTCLKDAES